MPLNPSFDQLEHDIAVADDDRARELRQALLGCWPSKKREHVQSIKPADNIAGDVYGITLDEGTRVPLAGGYVEGLLRYGWGYVAVAPNTLYVARIIPLSDGDGYAYEGGADTATLASNPSLSVDTEPLSGDTTDKNRLNALAATLAKVWPAETVKQIKRLTPSASDARLYVIKLQAAVTGDDTHLNVPLEIHADALLEEGWGVATIRHNSLFAARIEPLETTIGDAAYGYKFENSDVGRLYYIPQPCQLCGEREAHEHVRVKRDSEPPADRTFACKDCVQANDLQSESTEE